MLTTIGIIGAGLILLAFFLNQIRVWKSDSVIYELTNFLGAAVLTGYSWLLKSWPFVVLNIIWGAVALYEIANHLRGHKPRKKPRGKIGHKRK